MELESKRAMKGINAIACVVESNLLKKLYENEALSKQYSLVGETKGGGKQKGTTVIFSIIILKKTERKPTLPHALETDTIYIYIYIHTYLQYNVYAKEHFYYLLTFYFSLSSNFWEKLVPYYSNKKGFFLLLSKPIYLLKQKHIFPNTKFYVSFFFLLLYTQTLSELCYTHLWSTYKEKLAYMKLRKIYLFSL